MSDIERMEFNNWNDAHAHVVDRLRSLVAGAEVREAIAWVLTGEFERTAAPSMMPPESLGVLVPQRRWVIADDDLKPADALWPAIAAALAVHTANGNPVTSAVLGAIAGAWGLLWRVKRKGATLSADQMELVLALGAFRTFNTFPDVPMLLPYLNRDGRHRWTSDRIEAALASLTVLRLEDGTPKAIVANDGRGNWRCAGI